MALADPAAAVLLPNPGFEQAGKGGVDRFANTGYAAPQGPQYLGAPDGWSIYQWGSPMESRYNVTVESGVSHSGASSLRAQNVDNTARGGVYAHPKLEEGTYELSVWTKAEPGKIGKIAIYLASAYSRPFKVKDEWTRIVFSNVVSEPVDAAEINIQNTSGIDTVIWFDDIELRRVSTAKYMLVPDTRETRPRTLLFSPMNINYLRDTAKMWGERGFGGFLFDGVMWDSASDVWAADADAKSRGEDDKLLQELKSCNAECRKYGIDSNFVKVAFYTELPDWFDDAAWEKITENYRQGARFAKMSGCAGVAIDTEYMARQYEPGWEGYQKNPHDLPVLKAKIRDRWLAITEGMLREFPDMVLLTLPEGMLYYGELYFDVFTGMLEGMAEANAPGGLHLMTEGTYQMRDVGGLAVFPEQLNAVITEESAERPAEYWRERCSVVMGVWPLGYYRAINDENGKFIDWSGKEEVFGNEIVGSYADKSEWYPPEEFNAQMAGVNTFCPRYNWIYGHGNVFFQWTEEQMAKYKQGAHQSFGNALLPTAKNLDAYLAIIAKPMRVVKEIE